MTPDGHPVRKTRPVSDDGSPRSGAESTPTPAREPAAASVGVDDLNWPIPEATMLPLAAIFVAAMVWAFGFDRVLIVLVPFVVLLAAITVIDLRELRVPDRLVAPAAIVAVPLLAIAATSPWPDLSLWRAIAAGAAMGFGYFVLAIVHPAGMGLGDVKLSPIIGAQLGLFGWIPTVRGVLLAFLLVGPVALLLLLVKKAKAQSGLPFAPFMALGAIGALLLEGFG